MTSNTDMKKLNGAWSAIWTDFGRSPPVGAFDAVVQHYRARRGYHTITHLLHVLSLWLENHALFQKPACAGLALFYHDAIYEPLHSDNEARSADFAEDVAMQAGLGTDDIAAIRCMILATRHDEMPAEPDAQRVVDIDLSILGADERAYDAYAEGVRYEYRHVPGPLYRKGRAKVLKEFLARETVFQTPEFTKRYEARARENLRRELGTLA